MGVALILLLIVTNLTLFTVRSDIQYDSKDKKMLEDRCEPKLAEALLEYAKFHNDVLHGRAPSRHLVSVPVEAGLADRLLGMISQFWLAFFSRHAFQIGIYDKLPRFEYAYDYRFINWTRPQDDPKYVAPLMYTFKGQRGYEGERKYDASEISLDNYHMEYLINQDGRSRDLYGKEDMINFPSKSKAYPFANHTIITSSNRGGIHYFFDNPYMKSKLEELGAKRETMFRCAYAFLFRENEDVEKTTEPYRKKLLVPYNSAGAYDTHNNSQISNLRIGIGIRAGDKSFDPRFDSTLKSWVYRAHTQCATNVQRTYLSSKDISQQSKQSMLMYPWYAMSESLKTRQMLAEAYKEAIVVDTGNAYFHGDCNKHTTGGCQQDHLRQAIIGAVSQLQLFALCNVHIVSESGFPRVGAMLSAPPHRVFLTKSNRAVDFGSCDYDHPSSLQQVMSIGAGF